VAALVKAALDLHHYSRHNSKPATQQEVAPLPSVCPRRDSAGWPREWETVSWAYQYAFSTQSASIFGCRHVSFGIPHPWAISAMQFPRERVAGESGPARPRARSQSAA